MLQHKHSLQIAHTISAAVPTPEATCTTQRTKVGRRKHHLQCQVLPYRTQVTWANFLQQRWYLFTATPQWMPQQELNVKPVSHRLKPFNFPLTIFSLCKMRLWCLNYCWDTLFSIMRIWEKKCSTRFTPNQQLWNMNPWLSNLPVGHWTHSLHLMIQDLIQSSIDYSYKFTVLNNPT